MTLDKAIERLLKIEPDSRPFDYDDDKEAIRLGIEALKRVNYYRKVFMYENDFKLPGETQE